ncbi:MAG TPA: outer membrane lipoprotein-sorting protein [Blastocatellia bacterium]|jgi:hypothetical protein|nr:outer membrane lipoprotein-sorting protein [Blastocatellia bacterium]
MVRDLKLVFICLAAASVGCGGGADRAAPPVAAPASPPASALPAAAPFVKRMATQDGSKDSTAEMRLTLEGAGGKRAQLDFRLQRKYAPAQTSTFLTVTAPREETEKTLLAFERPDQATEALSYLAGLNRVARLNSSSQLSLGDAKVAVQELLALELDQYAAKAIGREGDGGEAVVKFEFTAEPDRGLAFPRMVGYFRERDQSPARFELYNGRDELAKTAAIEEVKEIQGRRAVTRVAINDHLQQRKLQLVTRDIKFDRGLDDALFTEAHLRKTVSEASRRLIGN